MVAGKVVNNGGSARVLTVGSNDASSAFAGSLSNGTSALALTKTGSGTQTLSGANT